jgi:hypothetical protein
MSVTFRHGGAPAMTTQRFWQLFVTGATKNSIANRIWILETIAIMIVENRWPSIPAIKTIRSYVVRLGSHSVEFKPPFYSNSCIHPIHNGVTQLVVIA